MSDFAGYMHEVLYFREFVWSPKMSLSPTFYPWYASSWQKIKQFLFRLAGAGDDCYFCLLHWGYTRYSNVTQDCMPDDSCIPNHRFVFWGADLLSAKDSPSHLLLCRQAAVEVPLWQRMCSHKACIIHTSSHASTYNVDGRTCMLYRKPSVDAHYRKLPTEIKQWYHQSFSPFVHLCNFCLKPPLWWYNPSSTPVTYSKCSK